MEVPKNITKINEDVLTISLAIDESNFVEDEANLDFSWYVESFQEFRMKILIVFEKPEYISAGVTKDMVVVELKNSKYFFSRET